MKMAIGARARPRQRSALRAWPGAWMLTRGRGAKENWHDDKRPIGKDERGTAASGPARVG
jgi:hypothetical protein